MRAHLNTLLVPEARLCLEFLLQEVRHFGLLLAGRTRAAGAYPRSLAVCPRLRCCDCGGSGGDSGGGNVVDVVVANVMIVTEMRRKSKEEEEEKKRRRRRKE